MKLILIFLSFCFSKPGPVTNLLNFAEIMERNILDIINDPASSKYFNRYLVLISLLAKLKFLIKRKPLYKYGFDYCDADLDKVITMDELATCEYSFLEALGRDQVLFFNRYVN